jgi:hypothetical protein
MAFHPPRSIALLLAVATGAMALSAAAQQSGQSIIFSAPPEDDAQSATPPLAPPSSPVISLPSTMQAPMSPFGYSPPNNLLLPPPRANDAGQQQLKKSLDERKNWTLMTPAEIFGVTTTDKSSQERDATGQPKNQTQLERYLDRQNQSATGHTNDWESDRANLQWNQNAPDRTKPFNSRRDDGTEAAQNYNRFFGGPQSAPAGQNENASWDAFDTQAPQAPAKPNPEQVASMERFRELLAPNPAPESSAPQNAFSAAPKPVVDPFLNQPAFVANPAGASFTPLSSGLSRPNGLTPLPGITTPVAKPATAPAWAPQPPPWVSQGPPAVATPQWKF